jgi:Fe-S-cluster containining protein
VKRIFGQTRGSVPTNDAIDCGGEPVCFPKFNIAKSNRSYVMADAKFNKLPYTKTMTDECDECKANCCKDLSLGPLLSTSDIERIFRHTKMEMSEFVEETQNNRFPKKDEKGRCIFLGENSRCTIYEARPFDCRLFPLDLIWDKEKDRDKLRFILVDSFCSAAHFINENAINKMENEMEKMGFLEIIRSYAETRLDEVNDGGYRPLRFISDDLQKKVDEQK